MADNQFDPSRFAAACVALDRIMDEVPQDDWDEHVRRCVLAVGRELFDAEAGK